MHDDFVTVAAFEGGHDANLSYICTVFDEKEIPYYLMDELSSSILPLPTNIAALKLRVPISRREEVDAILREVLENTSPVVGVNSLKRENEKFQTYQKLGEIIKWSLLIVIGLSLLYVLFGGW